MTLFHRFTYFFYRLAYGLSNRKNLFAGARPPKLLILDFSYEGVSGHHHALNKLIVTAAEQAGLPAHVLANKQISPALINAHIHPFFSRGTYGPVTTTRQARKKLQRTTRSFFRDMLEAGFHKAPHDTTFLVHTANAAHVVAVACFLKLSRRNCPTNVYLMLPPDFDAPSPEAQAIQTRSYEQAFDIAGNMPNIRFLCENRLLQAAYTSMGCRHIDLLDLPCELPERPIAKIQSKRLELLFIGDPRPEKGLDLIVKAMPMLEHLSNQLHIKLMLTQPQKSQAIAAALANYAFAEVITLPFFSEREYFDAMGQAHCVLLPYDPQAYRLKNSNMVSESLGCGTPVIVPPAPNSLIDHCKANGMQAHIEMEQHSAEGLVRAIEACLSQAAELQSNAARLRMRVIEARHPRHFIEQISATRTSLQSHPG